MARILPEMPGWNLSSLHHQGTPRVGVDVLTEALVSKKGGLSFCLELTGEGEQKQMQVPSRPLSEALYFN